MKTNYQRVRLSRTRWNKSGEFSAVCWDRIEGGRLVGGDSVTVTKEEFEEKVEKVIDIFGGAE